MHPVDDQVAAPEIEALTDSVPELGDIPLVGARMKDAAPSLAPAAAASTSIASPSAPSSGGDQSTSGPKVKLSSSSFAEAGAGISSTGPEAASTTMAAVLLGRGWPWRCQTHSGNVLGVRC